MSLSSIETCTNQSKNSGKIPYICCLNKDSRFTNNCTAIMKPLQTLISTPENLVDVLNQLLPNGSENRYVSSDPVGEKVGSGGGTAWLLAQHYKQLGEESFDRYLAASKKVIIHAGGQSRRLPGYAPSGKLLTPIPVFRWSRGQSLKQNLLDLQLPLYEKLMQVTPANVNTLIASGDVLILCDQSFATLPDADVVCLAIWADPHLASRHGVYFTSKDNPAHLNFMLQKPSHQEIEKQASSHLFLMDIGVWLLSDRAVKLLMKKCEWNGHGFINGIPNKYDFYSAFGPSLGSHPTLIDEEISNLSAAIVPLDKGEFLHYGTSLELITSTEKIQNLVKDQRNIWHTRVKPHPSLFVQNAVTQFAWKPSNHHIWVENSFIPATWQLHNHHVITGIPGNNFNIEMPSGICLDVVPIYDNDLVIRPYGMNDSFSGAAKDALWMGKPLVDWLSERNISFDDAGIDGEGDMQITPLFPVIEAAALSERMFNWLIGNISNDEETRTSWLKLPRLSAEQISAKANLLRLYQQRNRFYAENLPALANNYKSSVFFQVDLKDLAVTFAQNNLTYAVEPSLEEAPLLLARHHMLKSEIERQKGESGLSEANIAFSTLQNALIDSVKHCELPTLNVFPDQIVWARSPARLDLAGGWSDTPPYCIQSGGSVVNMGVDLNGQPPLQVFIRLSTDYKIVLRSIDNGVSETIGTYKELGAFTQVGSAFSIPRAAICLAGFHPQYNAARHQSLEEQLKAFGGGIEISLLVAIPKGSGLGTSSILASTVLAALSDFCKLRWDHQTIAHRTLILEQMLTTGGGWQDQYGGIFPGIKLIQSVPGLQNNVSINWLPDSLFTRSEYRGNWLLYYTGITRVAKNILAEIVRGMFLNEGKRLQVLDAIKQHAYNTFEAIQQCNFELTGKMIQRSWHLNNQLDSGTNTPEIQKVIQLIQDFTYGFKLLGAGGGGYLLMCAKDETAARRIVEILGKNPPNSRARFVDMTISQTGLQVSRS